MTGPIEYGGVLGVETDFGPVGNGASNPRYVEATDGNEYIIKGPSLAPDNPTVGGNELVAVRIAERLGLPVVGHAVIRWQGEWFFASNWMDKLQLSPALDRKLFLKCENRDCVYVAVVFDAWLINKDRHNENLIARRNPRRANARHQLLLNDHSHLLVSPLGPTGTPELSAYLKKSASIFVWLDFLREDIRSVARLREALTAIEGVSDKEIDAIVDSTPDALLSPVAKRSYATFLKKRRSGLRAVMQKEPSPFPNLRGSI